MSSQTALCRIRLKTDLLNHCELGNNLRTAPETRLRWAKCIADQCCTSASSLNSCSIRDWDLILNQDGTIENATEIPPLPESTPNTELRCYPIHYQIPKSVVDTLESDLERSRRTELFALGSLLYEVVSCRKPFQDKDSEEIEKLYAQGQFPEDVWTSPISVSILCCWCPAFAHEIHQTFLSRLEQHIKSHAALFSAQIFGGLVSIASVVVLPGLAALGFAATGPVLGSTAAAWQASVGLVEAGSFFAWCQSAAMGGAAVNGLVATGATGLTVAAGATAVQALDSKVNTIPPTLLKQKFQAAWERQFTNTSSEESDMKSNL